MENYEMLRALYDFQAAHAKTISFSEGEYFVLYQTSTKQRNWWPVVNSKGDIGFVPSNYVVKLKVEPSFLLNFLESSIESLKECNDESINGIIKKDELLQRLIEKRNFIEQSFDDNTYSSKNDDDEIVEKDSFSDDQTNEQQQQIKSEKLSTSSSAIDENNTDAKALQESPSLGMLNVHFNNNNNSSAQDLTSENSECTHPTVQNANGILNTKENDFVEEGDYIEDKTELENSERSKLINSENNQPNIIVTSLEVYKVIDSIRRNTNLSFDFSCEALRVVLTNLEQLFPNVLSPYLEAIATHISNNKPELPKELLGMTHDAKRLQNIFSQLAECKNDFEQRTWMLYEDEDDIVQFLEELVHILRNADEAICCYEMSCDHYQSLINLVQYYQMESRWCIKELLLKVFTAACHLDHIIVDILLTSTLPLEIVEDMKNNYSDYEKFKELTKVLTVIFSLGQSMPVNHQDHLGEQFVAFLFDVVEQNQSDVIVDLVIALILAFNLQFNDVSQNVVIEKMENMMSAKTFTEKILLLLNREVNPTNILKHSKGGGSNSVLKMFDDLFSSPKTANLFYTNDVKVLIDIIVRQLSDLSMGDPVRRQYLELCRKILRNTNYEEHTHRKHDLMKIFTRIFCEETECSANDQQLVRDIANEFPQIFKT